MTLVFTNGCFDILHPGHIRLLRWAREQGDRLVVGVNSDASVRRLKGPRRPIMPLRDRLELLEALPWVDRTVVFDDDTPKHLIRQLQPAVLAKGPECRGQVVPGADLLSYWGGRLAIPDWTPDPGHSTSEIERRIVHVLIQSVLEVRR